jgi:hypothetical protein
MLPTPLVMGDRVRVFYAACDAEMRGRIFFADFEREPPFALIAVSPQPVLDVGAAGSFDCDGVNPSQVFEAEGRLALLYIGWRRGPAEAPYTLCAGLAFSDDGGRSFERWLEPLLPPREGERLFRTAPFLNREAQGWRLLYIGGDRFVAGESGRMTPVYSLMELRGANPWVWSGPGRVLMAPDVEAGEVGFGRPVVVRRDGEAERLMVSLRTRSGYRLMESDMPEGPAVRRVLTPVIPGPFEAWERQMTCFGAPCVAGANELLFYNGNGYGLSGLGLAWRPLD